MHLVRDREAPLAGWRTVDGANTTHPRRARAWGLDALPVVVAAEEAVRAPAPWALDADEPGHPSWVAPCFAGTDALASAGPWKSASPRVH
jgi:hypothetical protein